MSDKDQEEKPIELNDAKIVNLELSRIQKQLKAPKGQFNSFGKYKYRNCEDILEAVKPLLEGMSLVISDSIEMAGDRIYIKATAKFGNGGHFVSNTAFAREPISQKGMAEAQITGSSSSYARKYALNGLFCIDDNKDPDTQPPPDKKPSGNLSISEIVGLTKEVETLAGLMCKGMTQEQKIAFINENIHKDGFGMVRKMTAAQLKKVVQNLKDLQR